MRRSRLEKAKPSKPLETQTAPPPQEPLERETVIMFVDIMGASEVSNHKTPSQYRTFVNSFQDMFIETCTKYTKEWYSKEELNNIQFSSRGDEGLLMIYRRDTYGDAMDDIDVAIHIALELKRRWLSTAANQERITYGLLPVELAVGIHLGRTFLEKKKKIPVTNPGGWDPEGYAINLAKRVESQSRHGRFTHIFLSEAAHGQTNYLANERTYLFDEPQTFTPKGISREIRVYELKHFFLPSDWEEESKSKKKRSRSMLDTPSELDMETLTKALEHNPTNLWLAEEFIRSSMLFEIEKLSTSERKINAKREQAFSAARERSRLLAHGDLRDAGILFIQGLIEGESGNHNEEIRLYGEAIKFRDHLAEAHWYKGQALSWHLYENGPQIKDETEIERLKQEALRELAEAKRMRSRSAWMLYDYGCERIHWAGSDPELNEGIENILAACQALPDVKEGIRREPYLKKVLQNPLIVQLLRDGK